MSKTLLSSLALVAALSAAPTLLAADVGSPDPFTFSPAAQTAVQTFTSEHPETFLSVREAGITRVFGKAFSAGPSPIESADAFVGAHSGMFGVAAEDLLPIGPFPDGSRIIPLVYEPASDSYKFTLVTYTQHLNGIQVFRSDLRVLVRNEPGFAAVQATSTLRDLGEFGATFDGQPVPPSAIDTAKLARAAKLIMRHLPVVSEPEMVVWAGIDETFEAPQLAYKFIATVGGPADPDTYQRMLFVVDAGTGRVIYTENQIRHAVATGTVKGRATEGSGADLCGEEVATPLPYAAITGGFSGTGYADANGNFSFEVGSPVNLTSPLNGLYFKVNDSSGAAVSSVTLPFFGGPMEFVHNAANTDAKVRAQVNAYLHSNIIRDIVIAAHPTYPLIAGQQGGSSFPINANISSTCNAFYDGVSINFYQAGGGCANTAFSTVVHHEYGHHVVAAGGSGQGAYGEGLGDIMGVLVTEEAVTGLGFQNNCNAGIRTANNDCQYLAGSCSSCGSEIHACGQLISGCVWDLRTNWMAIYPDYMDRLRSIVINSVPLHGNTGSINADIVIDYLTLDDDNGDINDGTPNYNTIADAFAQHGLNAPPIQPIKFIYPNGLPSTVSPAGTTILAVEVQALAGTPEPGTGKLFWRSSPFNPFSETAMTEVAPNAYEVALPASECLSTLQFYVQASTTGNILVNNPAGAPFLTYQAISAVGSELGFSDDMESEVPGWQAGVAGDSATTGIWVRVDPNGTAAQPGDDHSDPGTMCWITGQGSPGGGLGENDIDGGVTTLVSPTFDATGWDEAYVTYWRWYSNDTGASPNADSMPVRISNDNGATWVVLETVTENANAWVFKSFRVSDYVTPSATMKVRWEASDLGSGSLVEAGVDDFALVGYDCTSGNPADLNGDGVVDGTDLSILLGGWGGSGAGDVNGDGTVDAADLSILLGSWG